MDTGFILNRRPFRDNSLLVDLITKESGRITCIARVAKKRGKIMRGTLEPFRQLRLDWFGRGEVQTLMLVEEQARYRLPVSELCHALYVNELVIKLIPKYAPDENLFHCYQQVLKHLCDQTASLMVCEMEILDALGYPLRFTHDHTSHAMIQKHQFYHFSIENGVSSALDRDSQAGVPISGRLLIQLNQKRSLEVPEQRELRTFLNQLIDLLLAGKKLKSRELALGN